MEAFKVQNFERVHGANSFPAFRSLAREETNHTLTQLKRGLGLPHDLSTEDVLHAVDRLSVLVEGVDASEVIFDLRAVLDRLGFSATKVLVNWGRFESMDEFETKDLCNFFTDIFYPSADDLEILDSNVAWLLSIRHHGAVMALAQLNQ
ncbi:MAG TPA: hypothetical protein VK716_06155 [Terracidiphilus sp.]|nr:hypothetical protein [Terracidiphilus sp.]